MSATVKLPTTEPRSEEEGLIQKPDASPPLSTQALTWSFNGAAQLANLLPTGTVLAFQVLVPVFTKDGTCDVVTRFMTIALLLLLGLSCFLGCFTDTVRATDGKVYHGLATAKGIWLFDYPTGSSSALPDLTKYRVRFIDFIHGTLSLLVFGVVVMKDYNVVSCFYPNPGKEISEILGILPLGFGVICSMLSIVFPTQRRGIGYPVKGGRSVES